jgi:hypoxanthine phosphoribosyltransferase
MDDLVTRRGERVERVRPLLGAAQLNERLAALGREISADYGDKEVVAIAVLKGSILFFSDLIRQLDLPNLECDFLGLSSYGEGRTESSGVVRVTSDLNRSVEGKHLLVVEDIVDTGLTMRYLLENLQTRRPASVKVCTLLHKPARTRVQIQLDYIGFTIEDRFVVGYGLDYDERYRQLPWIGEMSFEDA